MSPLLNSPTIILTNTPGKSTQRTEAFFSEALRQVNLSDVTHSTIPTELMAYNDSDTVIMKHPVRNKQTIAKSKAIKRPLEDIFIVESYKEFNKMDNALLSQISRYENGSNRRDFPLNKALSDISGLFNSIWVDDANHQKSRRSPRPHSAD